MGRAHTGTRWQFLWNDKGRRPQWSRNSFSYDLSGMTLNVFSDP